MKPPDTLDDLIRWLGSALPGTSVAAAEMHRRLVEIVDAEPEPNPAPVAATVEPTWREKLWSVPHGTRLALHETSEALGKSRSWIYKRTGPKAKERIPCRRCAGELTFLAGELRGWIRDNELIIEPGKPETRVVN